MSIVRFVLQCGAAAMLTACAVGVALAAGFDTAPPDTTKAPDPELDRIRLEVGPLELLRDPRTRVRHVEREPRLEPFAYAARSVVWPGWGQSVLGATGKGFAYGAVFGVSIPLSMGWVPLPFVEDEEFSQTVGFALWATVAAIAAVDAFRGAERINRENGYDLEDRLDDDLDPWSSRRAVWPGHAASHPREHERTEPWIARVVVFRGDF